MTPAADQHAILVRVVPPHRTVKVAAASRLLGLAPLAHTPGR